MHRISSDTRAQHLVAMGSHPTWASSLGSVVSTAVILPLTGLTLALPPASLTTLLGLGGLAGPMSG